MAKVVLQQNQERSESIGFMSRRSGLYFVVLSTSGILAVYFVLSIGLTFYQRWLLKARTFFHTVLYLMLSLLPCILFYRLIAGHSVSSLNLGCYPVPEWKNWWLLPIKG